MTLKKYKYNPIISCRDVKPSCGDFKVIGAFNPGAVQYEGHTILALRVAERAVCQKDNHIKVPFWDSNSTALNTLDIDKNNEKYDFEDSRIIREKGSTVDFKYLTSMSHIRLARSCNGIDFKVDDRPFIFPENKYESFGVEDPRITKIGKDYYITFSAVSKYGIVVELVSTKDFKNFKRLGNIFGTENKDVVIFPEKINGEYFSLNRPVSKSTGNPVIWISRSSDLTSWGHHQVLLSTRENSWDSLKIGAGIPPIKIEEGWLELYHGVDYRGCYSMGAILLDINSPEKILGRSSEPILKPEENYEKRGFFSDVVFPTGAVKKGNELYIYYGICDNSVGVAVVSINDILNSL